MQDTHRGCREARATYRGSYDRLALLRTGRAEEAAKEAARLERLAESEEVQALEMPFFYGASQIAVAHHTLQGELAGARGSDEAAIRSLWKAVQLQDELPYMEPPYWYYCFVKRDS